MTDLITLTRVLLLPGSLSIFVFTVNHQSPSDAVAWLYNDSRRQYKPNTVVPKST